MAGRNPCGPTRSLPNHAPSGGPGPTDRQVAEQREKIRDDHRREWRPSGSTSTSRWTRLTSGGDIENSGSRSGDTRNAGRRSAPNVEGSSSMEAGGTGRTCPTEQPRPMCATAWRASPGRLQVQDRRIPRHPNRKTVPWERDTHPAQDSALPQQGELTLPHVSS